MQLGFSRKGFDYVKNGAYEEKRHFAPRLMLRFLYRNLKLRTRYGHAKGK